MTKRFFSTTLFIGLTLFSCNIKNNVPDSTENPIEVKTISAMKNVMTGKDLSPQLNWDTIRDNHLFAVAPLGRIEGEVTVIDGRMFTSIVVDSTNEIIIQHDWNVQSPFAVYARVPEWQTFEINKPIQNEKSLQSLIEMIATENGYDLNTAFPFRLIGEFSIISYHIISKPKEELEHNHKLHNKAKKHFYLENIKGSLLGFYSQKHEGVFTHKGHFIHTHFLDDQLENMGHLEDVSSNNPIKLLLPKIK